MPYLLAERKPPMVIMHEGTKVKLDRLGATLYFVTYSALMFATKKFGTLLYKLTTKCPKMIKKVKDPQQEYWENMMKKAQEEPPPDKPKRGRKTTTTTEEEEPEDVEDLDAEL